MTDPINGKSHLDWRSRFNAFLRRKAIWLPPQHPLRRGMRAAWAWVLAASGKHISLVLHGYSIRLQNYFRSFPIDYENEAISAFLVRLHPGDVVWDIGGNIGLYTILAGKKVGATGEVVTWDANPNCYKTIVDHVAANGLDSVCRVYHAALSDGSAKRVQFWIDSYNDHSPSARIKQDGKPISEGMLVDVEATTLDDWRARLTRKPNLIKIDVEGAEVLVLRGAKTLLNERSGPRPQLLLAVHPHMMKEFGTHINELQGILAEAEYETFDAAGQRVSATEYSEYFAVPREVGREALHELRTATVD